MLVRELFDTRSAKLFAAMLAAVAMMVLTPGIAHAYEVHVSVKGAGTVDEDPDLRQADMLNPACSSPQSTPTGVVGANCYPGDPSGDYGWGWAVRWKATPMPGWSFVRWESDGRTTPAYRTCDSQTGTTYTIDECQFGTYDNYQMRAVFADTTAPTASITGGPAVNSTSGRDVTFTFAVTDQPSGQPVSYRCKLTGPTAVVQDWTSCASSKSYSGLSNGGHTFEVEAKDPSNNATTASRTWSVDAVQPETTLTTDGPAEGSTVASNSATFQWTGSPDTQKYFCQVDTGLVIIDSCTSPRSIGPLGDGPHTFKVWAQDTHGNVETSPATRSWTIDTVPPSGTVSINGGATYTSSTAVNLTLSSSGASFMRFSNDTINWSDWETYATSRTWPLTSGDGTKTVSMQYRDNVGNVSTTAIQDEIQLDTTATNTTITTGPSGILNNTSANFSFSSSEPGSTFECKLDSSAFAPCTSPKSYTALANGYHTFSVRAKDSAGNLDATPAVRTWMVDTVAPRGSVVINNGAAYTNRTAVILKLYAADPAPASGVVKMRFSNDTRTWSAWQAYSTYKTWYLTAGPGVKTVYAQYMDRAGKLVTARDTITLDTAAPTVTLMAPAPNTSTKVRRPVIAATVRDTQYNLARNNIQLYVDGKLITSFYYNASTDRLTYTPSALLAYGTHTVRIVARDAAGNIKTQQWSFKVVR